MNTEDSQIMESLLEQGFPKVRAEKALAATKGSGLYAAVEWLITHAEDPDIDSPTSGTQSAASLADLHRQRQAVKSAEQLAAEAKVQQAMQQLQEEERKEKESQQVELARIKEYLQRKPGDTKYQEELDRYEEKMRKQDMLARERMKALTKDAHHVALLQFEEDRRQRAERDERERQTRADKEAAEKEKAEALKRKCQLQVRLFDGSSVREAFNPTATLAEVKDWVRHKLHAQQAPPAAASDTADEPDSEGSDDDGHGGMRRPARAVAPPPSGPGHLLGGSATGTAAGSAESDFVFVSMFPRKEYGAADMHKTLQDVGLYPGGGNLQLKKL